MTFDNMIARVRKIDENIEQMQDAVDALKGEKDSLEEKILTTLNAKPELFNVYVRKNASAGMAGRNRFKVTFSKTLARLGELDRLDDQEWLQGLDARYTKTKLSLKAAAIRSDYSAGDLTDALLRRMRLHYTDKQSLVISHVPSDSEVAALTEKAEKIGGDD